MKQKLTISTAAVSIRAHCRRRKRNKSIAPETVETKVTPQITLAHPTAEHGSLIVAQSQSAHSIFIAPIDHIPNNHDFATLSNYILTPPHHFANPNAS